MKTMTRNLKYFSGITLIFSIIFFNNLYSALLNESYNNIGIYASLFGIAIFVSGLTLGYYDSTRNSRLDLGFHYHLNTFIIVNCVGITASFISMGLSWKTMASAILSILFWGLGLVVHYFFSLKTIKGYDKKEIFD